ncbi:MAG: alpha/beta hydrolase [Dokdonella sp.]
MSTNRLGYRLLLFASVLLLGACAVGGDITRPVPSSFIAAPQPAQRLVVVLPGRGDSLQGLNDTGVARVIQQHWPDADVILTGLSMPFYRQGQAVERLRTEVIEPARRANHQQVWLVGISLGGMGALLYDRQYPDQIDGLILLSPYLGQKGIHQEIRNSGGLLNWQAGPPQVIGADTVDRELWRYLQGWATRPQRTRSVWLAFGADEPFRESAELISPLLPADHVLMLPGRHNWKLWLPAMSGVLERARPIPR